MSFKFIGLITLFLSISCHLKIARETDTLTQPVCKQELQYSYHEFIYCWYRTARIHCRRVRICPSVNMKLSKRHDHSLLYLLLIISGDIQLNPGPAPVRSFPNRLSGECKRILWQLHRLKVKLINGELHQQFLTEYVTNQVIPPGLKIKLRPQIDAVNDEFLKTWNDTISGTSFRLMDLLLKKQQANCSSLSKQINDKLLTLSNKLDSEQFQEVSMWLDTQDKAIRKETDTRKRRKFETHIRNSAKSGATVSFNNTERRNVTHQRNTNQTTEKAATATATTVHTDTYSNEVNDIRSSAATTPPSSELPPTQRRKQRRRSYHRGRHRKKPVSRTNHQNTVFNLSDRVLSEHEINILSRGLKFVPTPTHVNMTELIADVKTWTRRMRLKEYFWCENTPQLNCNKQYKKPPTWTPINGRDQVLDCYLSAVGNAILEMRPNRKKHTLKYYQGRKKRNKGT